jgi:hypothetical protein
MPEGFMGGGLPCPSISSVAWKSVGVQASRLRLYPTAVGRLIFEKLPVGWPPCSLLTAHYPAVYHGQYRLTLQGPAMKGAIVGFGGKGRGVHGPFVVEVD